MGSDNSVPIKNIYKRVPLSELIPSISKMNISKFSELVVQCPASINFGFNLGKEPLASFNHRSGDYSSLFLFHREAFYETSFGSLITSFNTLFPSIVTNMQKECPYLVGVTLAQYKLIYG